MNSTRNSKKILEELVLTVVFALVCVSANAATRYVPRSQYSTIQAAINACNTGDTVVVSPDTYTGPGNRNIYFNGKAITVRSETGPENCIIDGEGYGAPGFLFTNAETENSVLEGFTITNFNSCGIYCYSSSPTIRNCIISNNTATYGGGIDCREYSHPTITKCIISGNTSTTGGYGGGGIFCNWGCDPTISNCVIKSNSAAYRGGGIYFRHFCHLKLTNCEISKNTAYDGGGICHAMFDRLEIINCTVAENIANNNGGGLYLDSVGPPITISNSILWGNTASNSGKQIFRYGFRIPTFSFCDIEGCGGSGGGWDSAFGNDGGSNIDVDPRFVDSGAGDCHLMPNSPCNNAGDPSGDYAGQTDIDGEPRVMNGRVDIGSDECSEPPPPPCPPLPPHEPWSFVQISDTHITFTNNEARTNLGLVLNKVLKEVNPAFIVNTGDIVDGACVVVGGVEFCATNFYKSYSQAMRLATDAGISVYNIPGNHDQRRWPNVLRVCDNFPFCFKEPLGNRDNEFLLGHSVIMHNDIMFPVLDTGNGNCSGTLTDDDINFLKGRNPCIPKIILTHHPAVADPDDGGYLSDLACELFGGVGIDDGSETFINYCEDPSNNVLMVLSGHTHHSHVYDKNLGTPTDYPLYIQTGSTLDGVARIISFANPPTVQLVQLTEEDYNYRSAKLYSPGNLHTYDSYGHHTGYEPVSGSERGIPRSVYFTRYVIESDEGTTVSPEEVLIFDPSDEYMHEVVGTDGGTYGLDITSLSGGEETTFEADEIPTSPGARHVYEVDWGTLSAGGEGVILKIDNNGDGFFEQMAVADNELSYDEFALQTETVVDFDPDTLNLKSKGKFVTVYIELPEDIDVSEIDPFSLELNELIPPLPKPMAIGDYDNDGINDLMVKFDRQELIEVLEPGEQMVDLTGQLWDGRRLSGFNFVRVIHESQGKKN